MSIWNGMEWNARTEWNEMECAEWNTNLERIELRFLRKYKDKQVST